MLLGLVALSALAHNLPPQALHVVSRAGHPAERLIGTSFGALLSDDECSWRWVCDAAVGYSPPELPTWLISPQGTLFVGAFSGLYVSRDKGCNWSKSQSFLATGASDFTFIGDTMLVTTAKFGGSNGVFRSDDDGVTFTQIVQAATPTYFSSIQVAPSTPSRVYVASWYFEPPSEGLEISDDSGRTFRHVELTASLPKSEAFFVLAVDPHSADIVYAALVDASTLPGSSTLLKSVDAGAHFQVIAELPGVARQLVVQGDTLVVAATDGIYESTNGGAFTRLASPTRDACVFALPDGGAQVCGNERADGFVLADRTPSGLVPTLHWNQFSAVQACPADSQTAQACLSRFPVEQVELGLGPDAGLPECAQATPPQPPPGCHCSGTEGLLLWGAAGWTLRRFRRNVWGAGEGALNSRNTR